MTTTAVTQDIDYSDLYARWERGNWRATELDFSVDKRQWHEDLDDVQRRAALWNYSLFFHGEEAVAETLSPYIDAARTPEQKHFLTTQQVDETRHSVFFARFMHEVVGAGENVEGALEATRPQLTWGFRKLFGRLDQMAAELRKDPSPERLAAGVTLYHLIIEATLAQSGQHFIEEYLEERDLLPGFREGMRQVAIDEQRHIGFGVKLLSELCAGDPRCREAVQGMLREVVPWALAVFVPPGYDRSYTECFGFSLEDIYEAAARSFESKLRAAGLPPEELNGAAPFRFDETPRQRAERALVLVQAGVLGDKNGGVRKDPEVARILFDSMALGVDHRHAPRGGMTIQWDFEDFEPWHLRVDNGSTGASPGRASSPDLTLKCRFEDLADVFARREDPRRQMLTRKVRPRGNPLALLRMQRLFGG